MARVPQLMMMIRNRLQVPVIIQPRDLEAKLRSELWDSCRSSTRDLKARDNKNQTCQGSSRRPATPRERHVRPILPTIEAGCKYRRSPPPSARVFESSPEFGIS